MEDRFEFNLFLETGEMAAVGEAAFDEMNNEIWFPHFQTFGFFDEIEDYTEEELWFWATLRHELWQKAKLEAVKWFNIKKEEREN